ncbi:zinc finger protein ZFAT [Drosophila sechellia]|uniref:GM10556 n=1 Tax=Drosophila sechellia TaxID=7238 RepID=B4I4F7_DROSE|nr:zinc finger protein ZFAT [Drosophila sechellia]EDW55100.1 GM10556 [Drosophila sechellia]
MSRNVTLSDEQSRLNARLEAHMVYICPECGKAFRTQAEWRQHLNTKHDYLKKTYSDFNFIQIDERFHECQLCFKWVENAHKTIALLQYHYFMHLEHSETYRCVHCRMAYTRRRALNVHLLDTHMREIEKYENKLRQMKRQQAKPTTAAAPAGNAEKPMAVRPRGRPKGSTKRNQNDLLQKALMDIDLNTEMEKSPTRPVTALAAPVNAPKPISNVSELNLDRCLNAYEDIVRKEEEEVVPKYDDELDALCKEFFDDGTSAGKAEADEKPQQDDAHQQQGNQEVVIIEIDALGKEEVAQLKMEMKSDAISQPTKRRRMSTTPSRDSDTEMSTNGLTKLISYLCPKCGKEIASMDGWRAHVFKKHDFEHIIENSFKILESGRKAMCLQCREVQPTTVRSQLQKHCFKHLPYRSYLKCTLCDRTKTSTSKILNHIRYNHQEELQRKNKTQLLIKPEPMWASPKKSGQAARADDAGSEDDQGEQAVCEHCDRVFRSKWRYERHIASCRRSGAGKPVEGTVEALFNHLREGHMRMNAIWKTMQREKP